MRAPDEEELAGGGSGPLGARTRPPPARHLDRPGAPEPAQILQEAAQDLAGAGAHVEREGDDVVDHDVGRQVALALARPAGLGQDPPHPFGRERRGDHAQADVVAEAAAGG
jgi:hypothetical protein